jgi:preprotein translocase subunit YajC
LVIRPQQQEAKKHKEMVEKLSKTWEKNIMVKLW